ncbi:DUF6069 family protein [Embleya sp. NBC_00896]|uniref:DUF6069 family protein n=1 Tax=Embleya sp. NBC_00896 TaxID=2975961 RepID=UPI00386921AF|nr:DUF6069 family protein [Embleya sp. NBC_00896]
MTTDIVDSTVTTATAAATPTTTRRRALAVGGAAAASGVVWIAARALDIDLVVQQGDGRAPMTIGLPLVLAFAAGAAAFGWAVLALLEHRTTRARTAWTVLAATVLAVSLVPLLSADAAAGAKAALALMHVAVAAVLIPALRRGSGRV